MNTEALLRLAVALETTTIPPEQFDMGSWLSESEGCFTAGCAISWGHHLGVLPEGLDVRHIRHVSGRWGLVVPVWQGDEDASFNGPVFDAVGKAYGIARERAAWLFDPDEYEGFPERITPKDVAERIRYLIKGEPT